MIVLRSIARYDAPLCRQHGVKASLKYLG
jgi:hypothetical protein